MKQYDILVDGPPQPAADNTTGIGGGLRYNKGKLKYELLEPYAIEQLVKVFTKGAEKYDDNNWLKGMSWTSLVGCAERHLSAFKQGKDFDIDPNCPDCQKGTCKSHTGLLHLAHAAWNIMALISFHKHFPQGDDRLHNILPVKKIGLDIDEVICGWVGDWCKKYNKKIPTSFYFHDEIHDEFERMNKTGELSEFYSKLPPLVDPTILPFEPEVYISHRPVDVPTTRKWLSDNGFPMKDVVHVKNREEKVEVAKKYKLDIFVDDNIDTFRMMNKAGIACYLMDAPHNKKYDVGYKRIKSLKELPI
jgi:uncharacterized HAD superfamily protein